MSEPTSRPGVHVSILRLDPELPLPSYAHPGDAGADLGRRVWHRADDTVCAEFVGDPIDGGSGDYRNNEAVVGDRAFKIVQDA